MLKKNGQNGKNDHEPIDAAAKKSDIKKLKCRVINIYLFGFQGSAFTAIRELREFFHQQGYKHHEVLFFNFPGNDVLPDQPGLVLFHVNEMRFSKKFGPDLEKIEAISGVPIQILYIPAALFFRLALPDAEKAK